MAQISFETAVKDSSRASDGVGFFKLAKDESKVVRFMVKSTDDFEVFTSHNVKTTSGWRTVNCIGDGCPLCKAGNKKRTVFVMKMFDYSEGEPKPVVWTRHFQFANEYKSYLDNYGPLDEFCSKVSRKGEKLETQYFTAPNLSQKTYSIEEYPIIEGAFDNYRALGRAIMDKSKSDLEYLVENGDFPPKEEVNKNETSPYTPVDKTPTDDDVPF